MTVGGAVIGGIVVAVAAGVWSHTTHDVIATEISGQLNPIHGELSKQLDRFAERLDRFDERLQKQSDDLNKIKGKEGIAANKRPSGSANESEASLLTLQAQMQRTPPSELSVRTLSQKLYEADENRLDYWPTVLQFIKFASRSIRDVPPPGGPTVIISNNSGFGIIRTGAPTTGKIVLLSGGDLGPIVFDHCRIIFSEQPVNMRGVEFRDCVFELPDVQAPNPYLKKAVRELLASGLTQIRAVS